MEGDFGSYVVFGGPRLKEFQGQAQPHDPKLDSWTGVGVTGLKVWVAQVGCRAPPAPVQLDNGSVRVEDNLNVSYSEVYQRGAAASEANLFQFLGFPGAQLLVSPFISQPAVMTKPVPFSIAQLLQSALPVREEFEGVSFVTGHPDAGVRSPFHDLSTRCNSVLMFMLLRCIALLCDAEIPWDIRGAVAAVDPSQPRDWLLQRLRVGVAGALPSPSASVCSLLQRDYSYSKVLEKDESSVVLHVSPPVKSVCTDHGNRAPHLHLTVFIIHGSDLQVPASAIGRNRCESLRGPLDVPRSAVASPTSDTRGVGRTPSDLAVADASAAMPVIGLLPSQVTDFLLPSLPATNPNSLKVLREQLINHLRKLHDFNHTRATYLALRWMHVPEQWKRDSDCNLSSAVGSGRGTSPPGDGVGVLDAAAPARAEPTEPAMPLSTTSPVEKVSVSSADVRNALARCVEFGVSVDMTPLHSILTETSLYLTEDQRKGLEGGLSAKHDKHLRIDVPFHLNNDFKNAVHEYFAPVAQSPGYFVYVGPDAPTEPEACADCEGHGQSAAEVSPKNAHVDPGQKPFSEDGVIGFCRFGAEHGSFQSEHDQGTSPVFWL